MSDDAPQHVEVAARAAEIAMLRHQIALLEQRVGRLERHAASTRPLIEHVKHLAFWDFTPYEVGLDETWVAVDRAKAAGLMAALAHIDHWSPWTTAIEPRPQP